MRSRSRTYSVLPASAGAALDVDSERDLELTRTHLDLLRNALAAGWTAAAPAEPG